MSCGSKCPGGSDGPSQTPGPSKSRRRRPVQTPDSDRGSPCPGQRQNRTFTMPSSSPLNATYSRGAPELNRTYTRAPPDPNATYSRGAPELNRTYTRPSAGNAPCASALNRTYTRPTSPANATYSRGAPELNRTYTRPTSPANATYSRGAPELNRTYTRPTSPANATYSRGAPELNRTYTRPGAALNRTLPRPGPALDETYSRGPPALDRTFIQAPPIFGETFSVHSIMEDIGDGDDWNVSGALSIGDFEDDDEFEETLEDSGYMTNSFSDESSCEPCEEEGEVEEEPEEDQADEDEQPSAAEIREISQHESQMSVYDAEELNRTTAPRSSDINVPRTRIWQSLINTLNETENGEDMEFRDFVEGIQSQRRDRMSSSF